MKVFWVPCVGGHFHLSGKCAKCEQGIFFVTSTIQSPGVLAATCLDCGTKQGLYVLPAEFKVWALAEPAQVKVIE